jgi:peptidoglycan/LPS O-acetylase OafA/YrhL
LLGLTLICFPAIFGCKNDPIHKILGHKMFSPIAKISFCMYLVHFIVIMMGVFSNRMDLYWQPMSSIYIVTSDIFWTVILAVFLSLLVESPTLGIEKILTGGEREAKGMEQTKDVQKRI